MTELPNRLLLDTSACVPLLRGESKPIVELARHSIGQRRAVICEPVMMEMMQGARNKRQINEVRELISVCSRESTTEADWLNSGSARALHLAKGVTISPFDYLIAAVAKRLQLPVLTADSDFKKLGVQVLSGS